MPLAAVLTAGSNTAYPSAEVGIDPTHNALRASLRPLEHIYGQGRNGTQYGHYGLTAISGAVAGSIAANGQLFSMRWAPLDGKSLFVLLRLLVAGRCTVFTTGVGTDFEAIAARSFSTNASVGTAVVPAATQRLRTSGMGASLLSIANNGQVFVAGTAAITAGTQTLDTAGFGYGVVGAQAVGNGTTVELYKWDAAQHPLVLAVNEGFVVRTPSGWAASNTWVVGFTMLWAEVPLF